MLLRIEDRHTEKSAKGIPCPSVHSPICGVYQQKALDCNNSHFSSGKKICPGILSLE